MRVFQTFLRQILVPIALYFFRVGSFFTIFFCFWVKSGTYVHITQSIYLQSLKYERTAFNFRSLSLALCLSVSIYLFAVVYSALVSISITRI